jgi:hypothetical protein
MNRLHRASPTIAAAKNTILGFLASLIVLSSLHAQTATKDPAANANASAAPPTLAVTKRAPDDVTRKITSLVNAGKYAEAQQLTTGLLVAYPDDQRLINAKALLETLLAPGGSANQTSDNTQPTNNVAPAQRGATTNAEQFTGRERLDYDALIELARQAQQTTDIEQQKASLEQFMDQSSSFLQKHPAELLIWQLRAASAISLNDPTKGYEAGQKLLAAGAEDSNDPNLRRLLAQLKNKGWLDERGVEAAKQKIAEGNKYDWLIGTWTGTASWFSRATWDYGKRHSDQRIEFIRSGASVEGYSYNVSTGVRDSAPSFKYSTSTLEEVNLPTNWKINGKVPNPEWQPITSCAVSNDRRTITILALGRTFVFTKTGDFQNQNGR